MRSAWIWQDSPAGREHLLPVSVQTCCQGAPPEPGPASRCWPSHLQGRVVSPRGWTFPRRPECRSAPQGRTPSQPGRRPGGPRRRLGLASPHRPPLLPAAESKPTGRERVQASTAPRPDSTSESLNRRAEPNQTSGHRGTTN